MTTPCQRCGATERHVELTPDGPHHAKEVCARCGRWLRWLPKPDQDRAKRPANHRELVRKYGRGFCQWCLTPERDLPARQTLEGHHIIPYADGGTDDRANVLILCTGCHKLAHLMRTYYRREVLLG